MCSDGGGGGSCFERLVSKHVLAKRINARAKSSYLELCVIGHHALEANTNTLDHSKEDGTHDSGVAGGLITTTDSEGTTGEETSDDSIIRIFLLANSLNRTVVDTEKSSPAAEVTTEDGRARLNSRESTYPALTVGTIAETLNTVPDGTTDSTHAECTTEVAECNPGAGIARVIHDV